MTAEPLLSVSHLSLRIQDHTILKDISLEVQAGEVVGLIGPNGSGKTTLFNVLSGFLKPTKGTVCLCGEDITHLSAPLRARKGIGRVFQDFGIFRDMTLLENILVAFESLTTDERRKIGDLRSATQETLAMVQLQHFAKKKAGSLSGGQMRLLEIARTFKGNKSLLLLDEPTAGVSPKMTHQIADLIRSLRREGRTVLIIEHDLPFIAKICDRIIVLDVGEVALEGSPSEVQSSKKLKEIYFGADPTT
ncbi:MAG: ABC transporter ATP-binding protein [Candidatus Peribacteraceae bacterium]|nr:ABC transporter ATP-binding protein [Candidatus Peribacteraceae bacterium]